MLLTVVGCKAPMPPSDYGVYSETVFFEGVVRVATPERIQEQWESHGGQGRVLGFYRWGHLWVPAIGVDKEGHVLPNFEVLGHEFWHHAHEENWHK